jgi:DNA-binding response OmpR family regulator
MTAHSGHAGAHGIKILVVEDDPHVADLLSDLLHEAGYTPLVAADAETAASFFDEEWPALAILDVRLGESSGLDLLRAFKYQRNMPVVVVSAFGSEEARLRGFEYGADDYLTKPFSSRELMARIQATLRRTTPDLTWSPSATVPSDSPGDRSGGTRPAY